MGNMRDMDELIRDLQLIKEAAKKNNSILKQVSLSEGLKYTALLTGIVIIVFSTGILLLENFYGDYNAIPNSVKGILYILLGLCSIALVMKKVQDVLKVLRRYRQDINFIRLFNELYIQRFWTAVYPFFISITVFVVYFSISGLAHFIVPVIAVLVSMIFMNIQSIVNVKDTVASCQWMLFSGLFSLFFAEKWNPLVILMLVFGIGMLILYFSVQRSSSKEKRDRIG